MVELVLCARLTSCKMNLLLQSRNYFFILGSFFHLSLDLELT